MTWVPLPISKTAEALFTTPDNSYIVIAKATNSSGGIVQSQVFTNRKYYYLTEAYTPSLYISDEKTLEETQLSNIDVENYQLQNYVYEITTNKEFVEAGDKLNV